MKNQNACILLGGLCLVLSAQAQEPELKLEEPALNHVLHIGVGSDVAIGVPTVSFSYDLAGQFRLEGGFGFTLIAPLSAGVGIKYILPLGDVMRPYIGYSYVWEDGDLVFGRLKGHRGGPTVGIVIPGTKDELAVGAQFIIDRAEEERSLEDMFSSVDGIKHSTEHVWTFNAAWGFKF